LAGSATNKVGVIGAGKIGGSLIQRLSESGNFDLTVSDVHAEQLDRFAKCYGVKTTTSNLEAAVAADILGGRGQAVGRRHDPGRGRPAFDVGHQGGRQRGSRTITSHASLRGTRFFLKIYHPHTFFISFTFFTIFLLFLSIFSYFFQPISLLFHNSISRTTLF
jgi:threonine dehydrogenase-like Zn-dependent dehydrogenase